METDQKTRRPTRRIRRRRPRYAETVGNMPPLSNLPPYGDNEVVRWFASRYNVTLTEGRRLFDNARGQSSKSRRPFLIYDREQKLWHGINHQRGN